ncbi:MAG: M1 family metallopeptidase [Euryarchaeota archaeon]|nr:M1 family metallopeptidase [Euryarchaeota archaeon]
MERIYPAIVVIILLLGGCITQNSVETPTAAPTTTATRTTQPAYILETPWDDLSLFRQGLIPKEKTAVDQLSDATVYHLDFTISTDCLSLKGHEEICYTNREEERLNEIYLRVFPNTSGGKLSVSNLTVDNQEVEPSYEFQGSAIRIPLPAPLQPGKQTIIKMDFEVEVAQEMEGNYGLFGYFEDILALDEFYPVVPVYDDDGWNVENPPPNGDLTYYDASFYLVRVTAPPELRIATSGIEVSRTEKDNQQVVSFAAGPARDFYLAASKSYTVLSNTVGETTINSYAFSGQENEAGLALQFATDALKSYSERFGDYPYTEFDVVSTSMKASGMEYPGIIAVSQKFYDPETKEKQPPGFFEIVLAHETAHQWFYNVVGNDQVDKPWLDEAVVQYCTGLYQLDTHGETAAQSYRRYSWTDWWASIEKAEIPIGMSSAAYTEREYGPIVYARGPLFIEAVKERMGEQKFNAFLRDYYESNKWGIGTEEEFRKIAEQHCNCDLGDLFEEWVYEDA